MASSISGPYAQYDRVRIILSEKWRFRIASGLVWRDWQFSDGPVTSAEFVGGGQVFVEYNGGPRFTLSEGFSFFVDCATQAEVDA